MCLLHTHPADATLNKDDILDFYSHNSDGLGIMFAEDGVLKTIKCLPANGEQAWQFYEANIKGRDCVVHWRMKTHGQIDLENCHPYEIFGEGHQSPMAMMHNGILPQGNKKDLRFSDTWHYVQDTLKPLLDANPFIFNHPAFIDVIESHIGSGNRFVLMNHLGETAIMNEHDFVEYAGCKLSNTYAWDSSKGGYGFKRGRFGGLTYGTGYNLTGTGINYGDEDYGDYWHGRRVVSDTTEAKGSVVVDGNFRSLQEEAEEAEAEAQNTTNEFFDALQFSNFEHAFEELTYLDVMDFLAKNSSSVLWDAYDAVIDGTASEGELIEYICEGTYRSLTMPLGFDAAVEKAISEVTPKQIPLALPAPAVDAPVAAESATDVGAEAAAPAEDLSA